MMRATMALWHREIVRFLRDRSRLTGSLLQPLGEQFASLLPAILST